MSEQSEILDCPNCDNTGCYAIAVPSHREDEVWEWEQQQCQFCYCEPNSRFNFNMSQQVKTQAPQQ